MRLLVATLQSAWKLVTEPGRAVGELWRYSAPPLCQCRLPGAWAVQEQALIWIAGVGRCEACHGRVGYWSAGDRS